MSGLLFNPDLVRQSIAVLVEPGNVFEIRALEAKLGNQWKKGTVSGYFDNAEAVVTALPNITSAKSIYITLNPVVPDLLARRCNRLDYADKSETTADQHIDIRSWLLIDCDPERPASISSTDAELTAAVERADAVEAFLGGRGWSAPVKALSGNGAHLLYRIDLPADDGELVHGVLTGLKSRFSDGVVKVDEAVFNPARITKLYGTLACKGDNVPARPHRMSRITVVPDAPGLVSREQLEGLATELTPTVPPVVKVPIDPGWNSAVKQFDLQEFFQRHNIAVKETKVTGKQTVYILETCPFSDDHGSHDEVAVFEQASGQLGFKCHHDSCANKHWQEFRQHFEPNCYDRKDWHGKQLADTSDPLATALTDPRPKLRLPGPNHLLSDFATKLGGLLASEPMFIRNGEIVHLDNGLLKPMKPDEFRAWAEQFACFYKIKRVGEDTVEFNVTMTADDAQGVLAAPQFTGKLRSIRQVNDCRLPALRGDGGLELLPAGYDPATQTLTLPAVQYSTDMTLADAVATLEDLFSEFVFADNGRSKAVAVAGMVGLYAKHLLPPLVKRPAIVTVANAEGAGKGLLTAIMVIPTLGKLPVGVKDEGKDDSGEIRKKLTTAVEHCEPIVFLDNLKGHLSSPALEAFITASEWTDRKLGVNEQIQGRNMATVFITGNGLTVSPDIRRRSLFIELQLEVERAEDRAIRRPLDEAKIQGLRSKILAALWSLVRHWDEHGRPKPSKIKGGFEGWSEIVGGIVEVVVFGCPFETAEVAVAADTDHDDMRRLVGAMETDRRYEFTGLVDLARNQECFENIIGGNEDLDKREKARLGRLFQRYHRRLVGGRRFWFDGSRAVKRSWSAWAECAGRSGTRC